MGTGPRMVKDLLSDMGEAEYAGETYLLVGRANNLMGVDNSVSYFAAVNKRAVLPAPVVIIPVAPETDDDGTEEE